MKEIEVKILEIDKYNVVNKLLELGAEKTFEGYVEALFFDLGNRRLRKENKVLRLRKKGNDVEIALKTKIPSNKAKARDEIETTVGDFYTMRNILNLVGFREFEKINKYRESYKLNNVLFEFDTIKGIPTYLEIEAKDLKTLEHNVKMLGFSMKDTKSWTMSDVMKHYKKR